MDSSRRKTSWLLTSGAESKINQHDSGQLKSYAPLAALHTPSITDFFFLSATLNVCSSKNRITRLEVVCWKYSIMRTLRVTFKVTNLQMYWFIFSTRVEDHDDLAPIFNRQSDVLTSTYGMSIFEFP